MANYNSKDLAKKIVSRIVRDIEDRHTDFNSIGKEFKAEIIGEWEVMTRIILSRNISKH
jgi:hypothetical protein